MREHNPTEGSDDAAIVLVEFTDFQCPFCKQYSEATRRQIVETYGKDVRMVLKHYPLEQIHPQAMTAAIAAQCAHREGRFWDVHEQFFNQPNALDVDGVLGVGQTLGLSSNYIDCVLEKKTGTEVEQDVVDAVELGVQATPTFMINGKFLVGAQSEAAFRSAFRKRGWSSTDRLSLKFA